MTTLDEERLSGLRQLVPPERLGVAGARGAGAGEAPTRAELAALAAQLPTPELWAHSGDVDRLLARRHGK